MAKIDGNLRWMRVRESKSRTEDRVTSVRLVGFHTEKNWSPRGDSRGIILGTKEARRTGKEARESYCGEEACPQILRNCKRVQILSGRKEDRGRQKPIFSKKAEKERRRGERGNSRTRRARDTGKEAKERPR